MAGRCKGKSSAGSTLVTLGAGLVVLSGCASHGAAEQRTFDFSCDAAITGGPGLKVRIGSLPAAMSGTMEFRASREDPQRLQSATLNISDTLVKGIGTQVWQPVQEPGTLTVALRKWTDVDGSRPIGSLPSKSGPIAFRLGVSVDGIAEFRIGSVVHSTPVNGFSPEWFVLGCSAGEVKFTSVKVE